MNGKNKFSFRVVIVGCGNIAEKHMASIRKYINISDIALCDMDPVRLEDFAKRYGIAKTYTDISDVHKDFDPDIAHILTPPSTHKDIAIKCLDKGMNVLIEKPMCISAGEADEITQACKRTGGKVCIDHMRSFDEQTRKVRDILDSGSYGEISHINASYSHDVLTNTKFVGNRWAQGLPGGMLFDIAPHVVYLIQDFIPGMEEIATSIEKNSDGMVTGIASIFQGKNTTASMHISLKTKPLQNFIELFCTKGVIKIDFRNFITILNPEGKLPGPIVRIIGPISVGWQYIMASIRNVFNFFLGKLDPYNGLDHIIYSFYNALLSNTDIPVGYENGRILAVVLDKVFSRITNLKTDAGAENNTLKPADILVTGGSGLIGSGLVKRLADKGFSIRVLTHSSALESAIIKNNPNISIVKGDVYRYKDVENASMGVKTVCHLAAAMKGDWNYHLDTTVSGTRNIFEACLKTGVRHLVYTSTLNVLDAKSYPNGKIIDETFSYEHMPEKRGAYSHAKLKAERLLLNLIEKNKNKLTVTLLRPGLVYGSQKNSLPKDVAIRLGKRFGIVMGLGFRKLPLIYIDNLVDALELAVKNKKDGIFNIVDSDYPTQRKYIKLYNKYGNEKINMIYVPFWVFLAGFWFIEKSVSLFMNKKVSLVYKLKCVSKSPKHSTARAEQDLDWKQNVQFEEGIKRTLRNEKEAINAIS
ncbi:MAG: NAD-dependent epimerase/dehydratase family protein [Candidatus Omnitrophota bacterium]